RANLGRRLSLLVSVRGIRLYAGRLVCLDGYGRRDHRCGVDGTGVAGFGGNRSCRNPVLLVVVSLDDVANHGAGGFPAVLFAFLDQNGAADFRVAPGGIPHKPGVVFEFFLLTEFRARAVTNDLRCTGFAAQFDAGESELAAGAAGLIDDPIHAVRDALDGVLGKSEALVGNVFGVFQQVRLLEVAAGGEASDDAGELYRSGGDGALADCDGDGFTGIPLAMKDP